MTLPPTYVLTNPRRPSLTVETLGALPHVAFVADDKPLPPGTSLSKLYSTLNVQGHYNVFRAHQAMARRFLAEHPDAPLGFFFEDDATPAVPNWLEVVRNAVLWKETLGPELEVFFLYGRMFQAFRFQSIGQFLHRDVLRLRSDVPASESDYGGKHHVYGSLAYLMTRQAAQRFADMPWEGIPVDVILPDRFNFAFLNPSPFLHDRSQGSIIENTLKSERGKRHDPSYRVPLTKAEATESSAALDALIQPPPQAPNYG